MHFKETASLKQIKVGDEEYAQQLKDIQKNYIDLKSLKYGRDTNCPYTTLKEMIAKEHYACRKSY